MPHPLILGAGALAAVKAYFVLHGVHIATTAIMAGLWAMIEGKDISKAAVKKGATSAAADLLDDILHKMY
ncbi:hypothetical protein [Desulfonema magnum]|nr:hypothetical protein [Desulfonema magnum]